MESLVPQIAAALLARNRKLATAESCTGGLLGAMLTDHPGSSAWYLGGVIAYSNDLKSGLLGVSPEIMAAHGAVSAETARAMAAGVLAKTGANYAVAITGVAGPGGGSPEKPVGLVYLAIADPRGLDIFERRFVGGRQQIRTAAVEKALVHILAAVSKP